MTAKRYILSGESGSNQQFTQGIARNDNQPGTAKLLRHEIIKERWPVLGKSKKSLAHFT
jgi:hypothetical protein